MIPPSFLLIRVGRFPIIIPLLLLWPFALVLFAVGLALGLLVFLLTFRPRNAWRVLGAMARAYKLFAAFRGLNIDVKRKNKWVQIKVW
jgi:uncharacterized membrane protein YphA (DoxX/SURF4 family)